MTTARTTTGATATDPPIRRSSRRGNRNNQQQQQKQSSMFKAGDTVEFIIQTESDSSVNLAVGRLVSQLKQHNDATAMTEPCWIIQTLGQDVDDAIQVLESALLGHVEVYSTNAVQSYSTCDSPTSTITANVNAVTATKKQVQSSTLSVKATTASRKRVATNATANSVATGNTKVSVSPTSIQSSQDDIPLKKRKVVTFAPATSTSSSTDDDTATSGGPTVESKLNRARTKFAAASARAERSRRRQAIHQEQEHQQQMFNFQNHHHLSLPVKKLQKKRVSKGSTIRNHSRKLLPPVDRNNVIKVPMLTGTLYLYQGQRRHAEFVRRV